MWSFIPDIEPQPARGKLAESMWASPDWSAEEKLDGERRIAQFCGEFVRFTGRYSKKTGLPVEKSAQLPHLSCAQSTGVRGHAPPASLDGTVLDGELVLPPDFGEEVSGGKSKAVTSIANSSPEVAIKKQMSLGWLQYAVFDCLYYRGESIKHLPLNVRRKYVDMVIDEWGNPFAYDVPWEFDKKGLYEKVLAGGGEGVILKNNLHQYGNHLGWVKVKRVATADVVIMGYAPPEQFSKKVNGEISETSFYKEGLIGAIQCGQYAPGGEWNFGDGAAVIQKPAKLVEVATVSGIPLDLRKVLSGPEGKDYIGRVIEIEHNGREPSGRFRHPRFNRFRDDKPASACVLNMNES